MMQICTDVLPRRETMLLMGGVAGGHVIEWHPCHCVGVADVDGAARGCGRSLVQNVTCWPAVGIGNGRRRRVWRGRE